MIDGNKQQKSTLVDSIHYMPDTVLETFKMYVLWLFQSPVQDVCSFLWDE